MSSFQLEWDVVVSARTVGAAALDPDELQVTGDELESVFLLAVSTLPLLLVQSTHDHYTGTPVEVLLCDLGQAVKTDHPDPAGALFGGAEGQAEGGQTLIIGFPVKPAFGVMPQVTAESDVVNHGVSSFSKEFAYPEKPFLAGLQGEKMG
jgi:hypothetical protein